MKRRGKLTLRERLAAKHHIPMPPKPVRKKPKLPKPEKGKKPKRITTKNPPGGPRGINQ